MDFSKLKTSDWVVGVGSIVYLIAMFMPWYGISGIDRASNSGWSYFLGGVIPLILIVIVFIKTIAIPQWAPNTKLPELPVPWSQAVLGGAVAAAVIVLLRLLIKSSVSGFGITVDLDRKYGLIIAFLAAAAVAIGTFMKYQAKELDDGATAGGSSAPPSSF